MIHLYNNSKCSFHFKCNRFKSVALLEDVSMLPVIKGMMSSGMIWRACLGLRGN